MIDIMDARTLLKGLVQIVALALFTFQMHHSISQFQQKPVMVQTSTTSIDKIQMPIIFVCQDAQYDFIKSDFYGYKWIDNFVSGQLVDSEKITWNGKFGNATFKELTKILFKADYDKFIAETYNSRTSSSFEWSKVESEGAFIAPHGFCKKFVQSQQSTYFAMVKNSIFLIVDPQTDNNIKITHLENGHGAFGPTTESFFAYFSYEMEISLVDSTLLVGKNCVKYEDGGYQNCVSNAMTDKVLDWYGCLPPWEGSGNKSLACDEKKDIKLSDKSRKELSEEFNRLAVGQEFHLFNSCLPPCLTTSIKLKEMKHITNQPEEAGVRIDVSRKPITVKTLVYAYDVFDFVVDLGSALGLWFGLSALSIFDIVFDLFRNTKTRCFK